MSTHGGSSFPVPDTLFGRDLSQFKGNIYSYILDFGKSPHFVTSLYEKIVKIDNLYPNKNTEVQYFQSIFRGITCIYRKYFNFICHKLQSPRISVCLWLFVNNKILCSKFIGDHPQMYHVIGSKSACILLKCYI